MTSYEKSESIHPAKQVAALKAQIDNFEFELSKLPYRKIGSDVKLRYRLLSHIKLLKQKLEFAKQNLLSNKLVNVNGLMLDPILDKKEYLNQKQKERILKLKGVA